MPVMTTAQFTIPGKPEPQRRPRAFARGGHARVTDDPRNRTYADRVRWAWRDAGAHSIGTSPVIVTIAATFSRPKGHWTTSGHLNAAGRRATAYTGAPDADNIAKAICDALNGLAWGDDRQIVSLTVNKNWAWSPEHPGSVDVCITTFGDDT